MITSKTWTPANAIKARPDGKVEGLLVRYSGPDQTDLEGDYFDRRTNLGVRDGQELITLWHHNLDETKQGVIGKGTVKFVDAGLWYATWLNQRDEYEKLILKMVALGKCGFSGGAADILRIPEAGKARRIAKFTLVEGSITPTPMDYNNHVSLKALAFKAGARHSAADMSDMQMLHEIAVRQGAVCGAPMGKAATLTKAERQHAAYLTRELDLITEDVLWSELDSLEREMRIRRELDELERSIAR